MTALSGAEWVANAENGDMQGIIGGQIPAIASLELEGETVKGLPDGASEAEAEEGEE